MTDDFEELANLFELLGLSISIEFEKVSVTSCMASNTKRVDELFSVEDWLKNTHREVYDSYESSRLVRMCFGNANFKVLRDKSGG